MASLTLIIVGVAACGLVSVAVIGVAWAITSNRRPPSH
jgi:hypothetical protein